MLKNRNRFTINHFGKGLNTLAGYADPRSASDMENFIVTPEGSLEVRRGYTEYESVVAPPTHGCQIFEATDDYEFILVADDTQVYLYKNGRRKDFQAMPEIGMLQSDWIGVPVFVTNGKIYYVNEDGTKIYRLGFEGPDLGADPYHSIFLGLGTLIEGKYYRYYVTYLRNSTIFTESEAYTFDVHYPGSGGEDVAIEIQASADPQVEGIKIYRTLGQTPHEWSVGALDTAIAYNIAYAREDGTDENYYENATANIYDRLVDPGDRPGYEDFAVYYEYAESYNPTHRGETAKTTDDTDELLSGTGTTLAVYRDRIFYNPDQEEDLQFSPFQSGDPIYPRFIPTDILTIGGTDDIVRLKEFKNNLIIFKEHSIYLLSGDDIYSYNVEEITTSYGLIAKDAVVEAAGGLYFLSQEGLSAFSGYTTQLISPETGELLRSANLSSATMSGNARWVYLAYSSDTGKNDKVLAYNLEQDYVTIYDNMNVAQFTRKGEDVYYGANDAGYVYKIDPNATEFTDPNDTAISASWTSQRLDMGDIETEKFFLGIEIATNTVCDVTLSAWVDGSQIMNQKTLSISEDDQLYWDSEITWDADSWDAGGDWDRNNEFARYQGMFGRGYEIMVKLETTQTNTVRPVIQGLTIYWKGT